VGTKKMDNEIKNFFYPSSICIVGASTKEKSIGYELLKTIKNYGYTGKIFPVNPKTDIVLGYKCFRTIESIQYKIDLGIVLVPKSAAEETIDLLLSKGVKSIILISAGFKEVSKEGEEAEQRILKKIKNAGARLVGPNCMGVITTFNDIKLNATFVAEKPEIGSMGFLSQSGAIGAAVLNSLRETDIRFGEFISVGNKADISENDILSFWQNDERIQVITMYLESFEDGKGFIQNFDAGKINKPVIILKAGRTKSGKKAASSHTGALASDDKVVEAILEQFGIIRAETLNELFNTAKGFENFNLAAGNKIAVITNAGGPAILAVDALDKNGLELAQLSEETKFKLKEIVHPEGSILNPVDLLPGGTAEQFRTVNEILISDMNVDAVISIFVEPVMVPAFEVIEKINEVDSKKPIFQVVMPLPEFWEKYRKDSLSKKPLFRNPEEPSKVISNMIFYGKHKNLNSTYLKQRISNVDLRNQNPGMLSYVVLKLLADEYQLPLVDGIIVNKHLINKEKDNYDFPLVIKGLSKQLIHKSEINAVKLNVKNFEELFEAEMEILNSFNENEIILEEFLIQPYIESKFELLLGGFRDPSFGPMIMFGSGGKYVEVYDDTSIKSAYISDPEIEKMIDKTKIGKILHGVRGEKPFDFKDLKKVIKNAAQLMLDHPQINEFDFNPLIVAKDYTLNAVDVRIKIQPI